MHCYYHNNEKAIISCENCNLNLCIECHHSEHKELCWVCGLEKREGIAIPKNGKVFKKDRQFLNMLIISTLLSAIFAFIGHIYFQIIFYNDSYLKDSSIYLITLALTLIYSIPVILLCKNKYWFVSFVILILYFLFTLLFIPLFSGFLPKEDNPGAGILIILIQGSNIISILLGLVLGHIVNLIRYLRMKFNEELNVLERDH
ncbi:MAG: hypothetical protein JWM44_2683 [Bacilli bacterium]|nr:hypothetical protein [Bacilli bacterium]